MSKPKRGKRGKPGPPGPPGVQGPMGMTGEGAPPLLLATLEDIHTRLTQLEKAVGLRPTFNGPLSVTSDRQRGGD